MSEEFAGTKAFQKMRRIHQRLTKMKRYGCAVHAAPHLLQVFGVQVRSPGESPSEFAVCREAGGACRTEWLGNYVKFGAQKARNDVRMGRLVHNAVFLGSLLVGLMFPAH